VEGTMFEILQEKLKNLIVFKLIFFSSPVGTKSGFLVAAVDRGLFCNSAINFSIVAIVI